MSRKSEPTPHRLYRRLRGPLTVAPYPHAEPQYKTGPRYGQQLALVRKLAEKA